MPDADAPSTELLHAITAEDAGAVRSVLARYPDLRARLDAPLPGLPFGATPLLGAVARGSLEVIDVLLDAGADINVRSRWWAGGFGALDSADPSIVPFLVARGAAVDVNAAAHLGDGDRLAELLGRDPGLVHHRGGDGQTPLHVAATVDVARLLLEAGADIDARDVDHESTPAQYMLKDRPDVARYLVERGCRTDILMAAALGDTPLVRRHLDANPGSIRTSVTDQDFPKQDPHSGGTIYQWVLGAYWTAHLTARAFGHEDVLDELVARSPPGWRLAMACELDDAPTVQSLLASRPGLASELTADDRARLAHAARLDNGGAVRRMLEAGWPVDVRGQHGATPLHWAAWHGNVAMTRDLLARGAPLEVTDIDHRSTPLGWAIYGSRHGWNCKTGEYPATVAALLDAGSALPDMTGTLEGSEAVLAVLRARAGSAS
jgi:ankyrin repeat protein